MSIPADDPHLTPLELQFVFVSGRVSLAFSATLGERWRRRFDRLRRPADLADWLVQAGLAHRRLSVTPEELEQARVLRESIDAAARALIDGRSISRRDAAVINQCASAPLAVPQLTRGHITWQAHQPVQAALSALARDAIDLFSGPYADHIRACESDTCQLLFVDLSRSGRRRWCSSDTCGTRARSAAYRRRQAHPAPRPATVRH